MLSFANARRRLYALFYKPLDTMVFDTWAAIIDRSLYQPISHVLFYFTSAASASQTPGTVLDRLEVVWIWLNKDPDPPEHEYIIVETKDSQDGKIRYFIFDRTVGTANAPEPSRPISPLSSMEEGTPTHYPPVSFPSPQHSLGDALSLSTIETSQAVLDSLDKGEKTAAFDRILGESHTEGRRYGYGQNARQIKPNNLKLFELLVLAQVVHDFSPLYSLLERNCYWYCNIVVDAVVEIFGLDESISPGDSERKNHYSPIADPYRSDISGRWNGFKVSHTKAEDLIRIVHEFKKKHRATLSEVSLFFF